MLRLVNLSRRFANGFLAIANIDLQVRKGEIISFVGTSGCGKSTLLRMIAGLDPPTSGQIWLENRLINAPHPKISLIFQEPRLMPWLTVRQNIEFGIEHLPSCQKNKLTQPILERVGLVKFADALPHQLSGGMAQRTAIARALVTTPSLLLLDEPFSALDAFTRNTLQDHLLEIWSDSHPTMVVVTHDIEEALVLSDRIIIIHGNPGHIHQELMIDLPRPRSRIDITFQQWKAKIYHSLTSFNEPRSLITT